MKNMQSNKDLIMNRPIPVWCDHCYLQIAPYERLRLREGKRYHYECISKMEKGEAGFEKKIIAL